MFIYPKKLIKHPVKIAVMHTNLVMGNLCLHLIMYVYAFLNNTQMIAYNVNKLHEPSVFIMLYERRNVPFENMTNINISDETHKSNYIEIVS